MEPAMNIPNRKFVCGFQQPFMLASVLALVLCGCDFDPETDHVHSSTQPEHIYRDGVWWVPRQVEGSADEWFFVPNETTVVAGDKLHGPGFSVDILVGGKFWRCTKRADGGVSYNNSVDPPNVPPSSSTVVGCIIAIVFGFAGFVCMLFAFNSFNQAIAASDKAEKIRDGISARR